MVRQLLVPAILAVLLMPDWASGYYPCPCPCPPVVVVPACCPQAVGTVAPAGPTIVPERMEAPKKPPVSADPPKEIPAKGEEFAPPKPADSKKEEPKKEEKLPPVVGEKIPAPSVPPVPPTKTDLPPFDFVPPVKPSPDDTKPVKPQPESPKPLPPVVPAKKDEAPKPPDKVPAFDLDIPKVDAPAQPVEAKKVAVGGEVASVVEVFPREGGAAGAKRGVTFVNKSGRDILLTVDGQTTTLPSKTVLKVDLPAAFKWQIGGEPVREVKVPDGSSGVDVVIRK